VIDIVEVFGILVFTFTHLHIGICIIYIQVELELWLFSHLLLMAGSKMTPRRGPVPGFALFQVSLARYPFPLDPPEAPSWSVLSPLTSSKESDQEFERCWRKKVLSERGLIMTP
jgi:hypothetical protein